jgi:hypothetical protein
MQKHFAKIRQGQPAGYRIEILERLDQERASFFGSLDLPVNYTRSNIFLMILRGEVVPANS